MTEGTIALIGNPNVGKSAIFNLLTKGRERVGNWPGVTVEKKAGVMEALGKRYDIVDLPGTYGISSNAIDEKIAREYILSSRPDVVLDIVDATNLERNLYLTMLLVESGANIVIALNKSDLCRKKGIAVDAGILSAMLGVPVVETCASEGKGVAELKSVLVNAVGQKTGSRLNYGKLETMIAPLEKILAKDPEITRNGLARWVAIRILEGARAPFSIVSRNSVRKKAQDYAIALAGGDMDLLLADARFGAIAKVVSKSVKRPKREVLGTSDLLDEVLLNRALAIPIFLLVMWMIFQFAFVLSSPFSDSILQASSILSDSAKTTISDSWIRSLVSDGIINGWGFILAFLPPIFFLFIGLSFLEESGYLARAAFIMDRYMAAIGLPGRSFIPMLMGFGCNVPAIMAARSIEDPKDRLITILINPLMSCGARLPVYVLFAGLFFPAIAGTVVFGIYLLGILLAILVALTLRILIFRGEPSQFLMEFPKFQKPEPAAVLGHAWNNASSFLSKAAFVLFAGAIIIWFLSSHPFGASDIGKTYAGMAGKAIEPLFSPLGFDWKQVVALFSGLLAKEAIVGSLGILYGAGEGEHAVSSALLGSMSPISALAFMSFILIYMPCLPALNAIRQESGSLKWAAFSACYSFALAYSVALAIIIFGGMMAI